MSNKGRLPASGTMRHYIALYSEMQHFPHSPAEAADAAAHHEEARSEAEINHNSRGYTREL